MDIVDRIRRLTGKTSEGGQAMVETVLVLPVLLFFILGTIQLTLMHQARLMLEFAGFNAARTGSVWNGDIDKMRRAAIISLLPTHPMWPLLGGIESLGPIENAGDLALHAGVAILNDEAMNQLLHFKLINVEVMNPTEADFGDDTELDFDEPGNGFTERRKGQLAIRVTYFYKLMIPFANDVIWNSWFLARSKTLQDSGPLIDFLGGKKMSPFRAFKFTRVNGLVGALSGLDDDTSSSFQGLSTAETLGIWGLAASGNYYLPLVTGHTIRMQSNPYKCAINGTCSSSEGKK